VHVGPVAVGNDLSANPAACRLDMHQDPLAARFQIDRPAPNLVLGEAVYVTDKSHASAARSEGFRVGGIETDFGTLLWVVQRFNSQRSRPPAALRLEIYDTVAPFLFLPQ